METKDELPTFKDLLAACFLEEPRNRAIAEATGKAIYTNTMEIQLKLADVGVDNTSLMIITAYTYYAAIAPTLQMAFKNSKLTNEDIDSIVNSMCVEFANDMKEWVINGKK